MNAIGLISSDIKWASRREEWLFYSLSQLVKDVKLTFTVWAWTLTWCFIALVWHLIRMRPVVSTTISVCFRGRGRGGGAKMRWLEKCLQALQYCVYYTSFYLSSEYLLFPRWYSRSLWISHGTSTTRRTLRPTTTRWTRRTSCRWSLWRLPQKQRRCNAPRRRHDALHLTVGRQYTSSKFDICLRCLPPKPVELYSRCLKN